MKYEEYVHVQTEIHGQIEKPEHYHVAERRAIHILFANVPKDSLILDVGCGSGIGMEHLRSLGFDKVTGIELNYKKAEIAGALHGDAARFSFNQRFDVIYSSHSFEHMYDPRAALKNLMNYAAKESWFLFILPYPDTGDADAHCASEELGLYEHDQGRSVEQWFERYGLTMMDMRFDDFREPEIWLTFRLWQ